MRQALQKQMDGHREAHQKQLNELRNEITEKQSKIDQLTEYVLTAVKTFASSQTTRTFLTKIGAPETRVHCMWACVQTCLSAETLTLGCEQLSLTRPQLTLKKGENIQISCSDRIDPAWML